MNEAPPDDEQAATADDASYPSSTFPSRRPVGLASEPGLRLLDRYRIVRLVGQGAMGVVYEAIDEARAGLRVALKLLVERRPNALYRLKNEFRALAEVAHPNLVGLHGLAVDPHGWFVVMDLIEPSTDFLRYVRHADSAGFDEMRLRSALAQLLRGVSALHRAGKLHRDLKPHNVLVTRDARVVIVDFGLVGELDAGSAEGSSEGGFVGTPAYAAPEQALGDALGPKVDLYAVGVMLFEALTGKLPFETGGAALLLERKARETAPVAHLVAEGVPIDLSELGAALLQRDPALRPDAQAALRALGEGPPVLEAPSMLPFVARHAELFALRNAAAQARQGTPVVVALSGPSGIGKTALMARFLELVQGQRDSVVLRARCHPHERVPYNALDSLVDALGRHLLRLSPVDAASLMPRDVALLACLFPTLLRVPAVQQMPCRTPLELDSALFRARAFTACKELLARLAERAPLILCVDDLQWGDHDSAELLREIFSAPGAPSCLVMAAFRETEADNGMFATLRSLPGVQHVELPLAPLDEGAATELTRSLLGADCGDRELRLVVSEAAGNPFLLKELGREASARGMSSGLREAVRARMVQLDQSAKDLLELVCLAGRPLELGLAARAASATPSALPAVLASALLRTNVRGSREFLESYHERIRDAVTAGIDPARRAYLHEKLAYQLEREDQVDPELVAQHYRAAGRALEAAPYTLAAAQRASRVFAFARAIELYELALSEADPSGAAALEFELAEVCARSGRLAQAAEHYQRALRGASGREQRRELTSKAMVVHLLAEQIEPGVQLLDALCRELGMTPLPRQLLLTVAAYLLLLARYLLGPRIAALPVPSERPRENPGETLDAQRIALCLSASRGFVHTSVLRCAYFGLRAVVLTRRARDRRNWPIALAGELLWRATGHGEARAEERRTMQRAIALAEAQGDQEMLALVLATAGTYCIYTCQPEVGEHIFERTEEVLSACGRSVIPLFNGARSGRLSAWILVGQMQPMLQYSDAWIAEARALGDPWGELMVQVLGSYRFLALDDPQAMLDSLAVLATPRGEQTYYAADAWYLGDPALYVGDAELALAHYEKARRARTFRSVQQFSQHRTWCSLFLARACLAADFRKRRAARLRRAEREARRLQAEGFATAAAAAAQIRGTLAKLRGDDLAALTQLERAADRYASGGARLQAAAVRHRLGLLGGGDGGAAMRAEARATALELGVRNPERWFRSLVPGFGE